MILTPLTQDQLHEIFDDTALQVMRYCINKALPLKFGSTNSFLNRIIINYPEFHRRRVSQLNLTYFSK